MTRRLLISFSGGETSGLMARLLLTRWRDRWDDIRVTLANTGEENEETLIFADRCDREFGLNLVWLEAVVHPGRASSTHRIVSFETASRNGEPFEAVIQKYGIPNADWLHCTRELKMNPMRSYLDSIGWLEGTYDKAIGIRADEAHRRSKSATEKRIIYPLLDWLPTTKLDVNEYWQAQPFRLDLAGYQGNCRTCWKKSDRKLLTIMGESPEKFDFFDRMEQRYGYVGPEFTKPETPAGYRRVFFRKSRSTADMRNLYEEVKDVLDMAPDDAAALPENHRLWTLDDEPDASNGCSESCDVTFEEESCETDL